MGRPRAASNGGREAGMMRAWVLAVLLLSVGGSGLAQAGVSFEFQAAYGGFGIGRESFDQPVDAVVDREENIYVVDRGNNRIEVLDRRGRYLREWGRPGIAPGSFDGPSAIAIERNAGILWVVDTNNHRLQKFDLKGKLLMTLGSLGSAGGEFNKPSDVTFDKNGNLYVADTGNNRVQKFDPSGRLLSEWGKFSRWRKGLEVHNPMSVAYSSEGLGAVYVVNSPDCRILKYDTDGVLIREWPIHPKGEGMACGPARIRIEPRLYTVYIADTGNDRVILFDKNGELLGDLKGGKAPFRKPRGVFISDLFEEQLVVADTGNNLVQILTRRGR